MSAKPESASFEMVVAEALARMKEATEAGPSYQVDRSNGQWIVRRAATTGSVLVAETGAAGGNTE